MNFLHVPSALPFFLTSGLLIPSARRSVRRGENPRCPCPWESSSQPRLGVVVPEGSRPGTRAPEAYLS